LGGLFIVAYGCAYVALGLTDTIVPIANAAERSDWAVSHHGELYGIAIKGLRQSKVVSEDVGEIILISPCRLSRMKERQYELQVDLEVVGRKGTGRFKGYAGVDMIHGQGGAWEDNGSLTGSKHTFLKIQSDNCGTRD
jgi:hypothetical protein